MKPAATIRRATVHDLDGILAAERSGFTDEAFTRKQLRYLVTKAKGAVFAATIENEVAAYVSILSSSRHGQGRIYSLVVLPKFRGLGLAGKLVDAALAFAAEAGLKAVFLEVEADNLPALSLYRKKGFVERCAKPGYYRNGSDALSMVRRM